MQAMQGSLHKSRPSKCAWDTRPDSGIHHCRAGASVRTAGSWNKRGGNPGRQSMAGLRMLHDGRDHPEAEKCGGTDDRWFLDRSPDRKELEISDDVGCQVSQGCRYRDNFLQSRGASETSLPCPAMPGATTCQRSTCRPETLMKGHFP